MELRIDQQSHGYKNGHQLLASSIKLPRTDQDVLDRLSDISGPLRPGELLDPYLTGYPLPSGTHYVLAKTWQDVKASRAGCVLTHSLLIPMKSWEAVDYLSSLVDLLTPPDKQRSAINAIAFHSYPVRLPPTSSQRTSGLIEAIFLEDRKPIILYDEPEAEAIVKRLLSAFWPSLRRTFSICTLALSPRTIGGRAFDLTFAPQTARSRFAHWDGRVVEQQSDVNAMPRHRWTAVTAKHVFVDDPPSLMSLDTLGVLHLDEQGDESNLRLALLWNELLDKSEHSPTAVLGLLDILNSRGTTTSDQLIHLGPLICHGVDLAQSSLHGVDSLRFLFTLLGKFPSQKPSKDVLNKIREALAEIARQEPRSAIGFLRDTTLGKRSYSPIVLAGIADGLASLIDNGDIVALLSTLRAEDILGFLGYSRLFADSLMFATTLLIPERWVNLLVGALSYPDDDLRVKSRCNVVPLLRTPEHAPLLSAVLRDVDTNTLVSLVSQIGEYTNFEIAAFDEPFRRAVRGTEGMIGLRTAILSADHTTDSDRFLLATLQPSVGDVEWLFTEERLGSERRATLLIATLSRATEREIQYLAQYADLSDKVESVLATYVPTSANQLASILTWGNPPIDRLLRNGCCVLPFVQGSIRTELVDSMLSRGLSYASAADDDLLRQLVNQSARVVDAHKLIAFATPSAASAERVSSNVVILSQADVTVHKNILSEIEELNDRLVARRNYALSDGAIQAWSRLLVESGAVNRRAQIRAAGSALSYALEKRDLAVSPIIVAAFPIVYAELKVGKDTPSLFSFFFTDWDRCKTARHDLVRAFVTSNWPPLDLVRAVIPTGDMDRVYRRLLRERDGDRFLSRLKQDLDETLAPDRKRLESSIASAMIRVDQEWDEHSDLT